MNKKPIYIIVASVLFVAIVLVMCFTRIFVPTLIGAKLYQGPRIIVEMHISVDGKNAEVIKTDNTTAKLKTEDGLVTLTDRISDCGLFKYELEVNGIPVVFEGYHYEWWEVIESNLYLNIDTKNNTYTISENYFHTEQDNFFFCHRETKKEYPRTYEGLDIIKTYIGS